ncbi:conjugal transfer protein [Bacilli bacterium]|nr:hypothetical protein WH51_11490 [Bacilli bacterium VT-13-104]PZD83163.1 conjugal transfer protein [Bacilli bacterium]PZD84275.1 conjugal transfer protein [Bacilli bacterium]PZD86304.1 conjugal transfer protein [Bacilli bacterium]RCO04287.1 conjugal transfer protein [Bacilli bacterium]
MNFLNFFILSAANVQGKINSALLTVQGVLTGIVVTVGVCVALFNVVTKLPNLSDPHEKNQFWKTQGYILAGVAFGAAVIWLIPWAYGLFT